MDQWLCLEGLLSVWGSGCALMDLRHRRIPNSLTLGAVGVAILYLLVQGRSILGASPLSAVAAGIGAIGVFAPLLWRGWLGAGDIKMMSAIGFIGGVKVLVVTFVFSSLLTLPVVLWIWFRAILKNRRFVVPKIKLPQGVFIALGLMLSLLDPGIAHAQ